MESFSQSFQLSDAGKNNRRSKPASISNVTEKCAQTGRNLQVKFTFLDALDILLLFSTTRGGAEVRVSQFWPSMKAVEQFNCLSVTAWLPRKRLCGLPLNNSFLFYVPPKYPVCTESTFNEGSWML